MPYGIRHHPQNMHERPLATDWLHIKEFFLDIPRPSSNGVLSGNRGFLVNFRSLFPHARRGMEPHPPENHQSPYPAKTWRFVSFPLSLPDCQN